MDPYNIDHMESREGLQNPSQGTDPFLKAGVGGALVENKLSCFSCIKIYLNSFKVKGGEKGTIKTFDQQVKPKF